MSPEERLEALREDARWNPITLQPEHGRRPADAAGAWRMVIAGLVAAGVLGAVFGGISWYETAAANRPPSVAGLSTKTPSPTPSPLSDDLSPRELLALAASPPNAVVDASAALDAPVPAEQFCGLATEATTWWKAPSMTSRSAEAWLEANPPGGTSVIAKVVSPASSIAVTSYVLDAAHQSSKQGLLFSVYFNNGDGVLIRVDAVSLPQGAACVASVASLAQENARLQQQFGSGSATPDATADPAAMQRAEHWLQTALVPTGAQPAATKPTDSLDLEGPQGWWCQPMVRADRYWTLDNARVDDVANWLRQHPTPGMVVSGPASIPASDSDTIADVIDLPSANAAEGLDFTIAQLGNGVAIRADAAAKSATAACETAAPGTERGIGG